MAKVLSYRPLTAEARDPSQVSSCEQDIVRVRPVYSCHHSTNAPYIFIYTLLLQERQISEPLEHSKMQLLFSEIWDRWTGKYFHCTSCLKWIAQAGICRSVTTQTRVRSWSIHVRFVVENVAFVQVLFRVIRLSAVISISTISHTHSSVTKSAETQQLTHLTIAVVQLVEAMRYKPRGRGFYSRRRCRDFSLT